jgi:hypothetical protein
MVSYYFRLGPRIGLPPVWEADQGLTVRAIDELARAEGLQALAKPAAGVTRDFIADALSIRGPIWAAIHLGRFGHAIALTGIKGDTLYYNDPWEPAAKTAATVWFISRLYQLPNSLLVKDRSRS